MGQSARPLGEIIRTQRRLSRMSLRQLAAMSAVSNPYLSQVERGLHEPSMRILQSIADALDLSIEALLREAGMLRGPDPRAEGARGSEPSPPAVEAAIAADGRLSPDQKDALTAVYRSYVGGARP